MAVNTEFNAAAVELVKARGASAIYTQSSVSKVFNVLVEHDLEIIDPESGAGSYVTAAIIAKTSFPFSRPDVGDTVLQDSRTWQVTRQLEDDGYLITLELI